MTTTEPITEDIILESICEHFGVSPEIFLTESRGPDENSFIRQVYTYCLWLFTKMKQGEISKIIDRHRTIVITTVRYIRRRCLVDDDFRKEIIRIESMFD